MADLVNMGANVLAYEKNHHKYAMTCAWCMQCGYEEVLLLVGSQSVTGHHLEVNDIVGVSALSDKQENIALHYGDNHSDTYDKFKDQKYHMEKSAILIDGARVEMVGLIKDITHLKDNDEDLLVHIKVISSTINEDVKFLSRLEMRH